MSDRMTAEQEEKMTLTENEIMDAFQEAFPGHDLHQESIDFARAVERRVLAKVAQDCGDEGFYCGDPECDACVPLTPSQSSTFWLIERGPNQGVPQHQWWNAGPDGGAMGWKSSVHDATQYPSKEAAEQVVRANRGLRDVPTAITSHGFVGAA
jgi:hypothetical protein